MNRTRLLIIGFLALALGAFVSYTVYNQLQAKRGNNDPGVDVVVAAGEIAVGAKVEDKDIKVMKFPAANAPPGYYSTASTGTGRHSADRKR